MNKRIAKKMAVGGNYSALAYLYRRQTPYRRTRKILARVSPNGDLSGLMTPAQVGLLVDLWREQRPYIWRGVSKKHTDIDEAIQHGQKVAAGVLEDNPDARSLHAWLLWSLAYYSDRWCVWRIAVVDKITDHMDSEPK